MNKPPKSVDIFTDGACLGNPGAGGYGVILSYQGTARELSGGEVSTTNNRMELLAAITGLEALKEPCRVRLYSDSRYLVQGMNEGWAKRWRANGWMRNKKEPALNTDLWDRLLSLCDRHETEFVWVRGHADHPQNNRCDALATAYAKKMREAEKRA